MPSATTSKPIIAGGTEYSTGITVSNAEKDYQRLTGAISIGGKTGQITVTIPKGAKPGTYPVEFPKTDGSGAVTVNVEVKQPANSVVTEQGSSENLQKCLASMSSEDNPVLWLVPVGLLIALGAPIVGPLGEELGRAVANVSAHNRRPRCKNPHKAKRPDAASSDLGFSGGGCGFLQNGWP